MIEFVDESGAVASGICLENKGHKKSVISK